MPNMFIVGTLQGKTFTAKEMYDIFSKTSSLWTKESDRGLGNSFKGPLVDKAFKLDHKEKTLEYKAGANADILALAEDYLRRDKSEKAAQIYFALTSNPYANNPENLIGRAYDALLKLYSKDGALAKQTLDGKSIYTLIMELANKHKAALELANKKANDSKAAQESKAEESKQEAAPLLVDAPALPVSTENNIQTAALETITIPAIMPDLSATLATTPKSAPPLQTPKSPKVHAEPAVIKPVTPVASSEIMHDAPVITKITTPPVSPAAAPSSPKTKSVTPAANSEEKLDASASDKIVTPAPAVSPTATATSSSPKSKPVTPAVPVDQHDSALFDANDIPASQPTAAASSASAPTPPSFLRVEMLLDNLNAIAAKHPAIGATLAIQNEQKAMFVSNDKATLSLKDLSYNELKHLTNHMHQVQSRKKVDTRFDHVRTETSSLFKHLTDGKGETPVWQAMRSAVKTQMMIQAALQAQKAERDMAAQKAAETLTATVADASTTPAPLAPAAPATNAKIKLSAEHHQELATLAGQHAGRLFSRVGRTNTTKFFNAHFEKVEPEVAPSNTSTNTKRM
jgi:hypothetical protein